MFCVTDWPLCHKMLHCFLVLCVIICTILFFFCLTLLVLIHYRCRDPHNLRTDAEIIAVLQRAWLLPKDGPVDPAVEAKFSLDSIVGDEGL